MEVTKECYLITLLSIKVLDSILDTDQAYELLQKLKIVPKNEHEAGKLLEYSARNCILLRKFHEAMDFIIEILKNDEYELSLKRLLEFCFNAIMCNEELHAARIIKKVKTPLTQISI